MEPRADGARGSVASALRRPEPERERLAEEIAERLHTPVAVLGVIFALVVLGELLAEDRTLRTVLVVAAWVIWSVFVFEFALRLVIAPSTTRFLKRNWWQILFLAVPFLRFLALFRVVRAGRVFRLARAGRVVSSAVRASRTARATLATRLGWLAALTLIVILASGQLMFEFGEFRTLAEALHATALATVVGETFGASTAWGGVLEIALAVYSVVVFAALAGAVGAFFLERRGEQQRLAQGGGAARDAERL